MFACYPARTSALLEILMKDSHPSEAGSGATEERALARKYGLRELVFPESEQLKTLCHYLTTTVENGRSAAVPKTAVVVMLEFLQGTINRQYITKSPTMSQEDFDLLSKPYYLSARIISKIARDKRDAAAQKGTLYQTTFLTLTQLIELLTDMLDPACPWLRARQLPRPVIEAMEALCAYAQLYPEVWKRGRAL
jgi:hypothetical protein